MKRTATAVAAALIALTFSACQKEGPVIEEEGSASRPAPAANTVADPQGAIDKIYEGIDIKEISVADDSLMEDTLGFDLMTVEAYYVRYSSGRYGLADTYIIKPTEDGSAYDMVREQLEEIKYDRIASTANYDVLDANKIARGAEIFQYGGYLVMLMLPDNDAAEEIIEQYIPSTEIVVDRT